MKPSTFKQIALLAVLAASLHAAPGFATRIAADVVSGSVTSVAGGHIVIGSKSYNIQLTGPALNQMQQLHVGQVVDLVLNGPPGAAATQVVAIHVHNPS